MDALLGLTASLPTWAWLVLVIIGCLFGIIAISQIGYKDGIVPLAQEVPESGFPKPLIIHQSRVDGNRVTQEMQHARHLLDHPHRDAVLYSKDGDSHVGA